MMQIMAIIPDHFPIFRAALFVACLIGGFFCSGYGWTNGNRNGRMRKHIFVYGGIILGFFGLLQLLLYCFGV